eukprot:921440-Pyramimonas_sp.AAC.1
MVAVAFCEPRADFWRWRLAERALRKGAHGPSRSAARGPSHKKSEDQTARITSRERQGGG